MTLRGEMSQFTDIREERGGKNVLGLTQKLYSGVILPVTEITLPLVLLNIPKTLNPQEVRRFLHDQGRVSTFKTRDFGATFW